MKCSMEAKFTSDWVVASTFALSDQLRESEREVTKTMVTWFVRVSCRELPVALVSMMHFFFSIYFRRKKYV